VSEISFGAWAIGGSWGAVDDETSYAALERAIDLGVNFIDTADVYGNGRSERLVGRLLKARREKIIVATKAGRRLSPHVASGYTEENLAAFVERSLRNLGVDAIDLLQLHCPPTEVYSKPEVFAALDNLVRSGKLRYYGVSVETVDEALTAIRSHPGVQSVQIIFNAFRQKPADAFLTEAAERRVGIIARVPLASGLLTGKLDSASTFGNDDHRRFNRHGEAFDVGETFSGVDYDKGLAAVDALRGYVPQGTTMAQWALRWILMHPQVTCAIPGIKTPEQAEENTRASDLPALSDDTMAAAKAVYAAHVRESVHARW
jgi:aryl-alcohol dehydrogenase-like predicted oxidoreductase